MRGTWLRHHYLAPVGGPRLLVLFHYAGGAASAFRDWPALVGTRAETVAVQLPGREGRLDEALIDDLAAVTAPIIAAIAEAALGRQVLLFGHSMGASLAYHIARTAVESRAFALAALAVSARRAPHIPPYERDLRTLDDTRILDELRVFDELPAELLAEPDLTDSLIRRTRADFCIAEACRRPAPPLRHERMAVPVLAFGGVGDPTVTASHLQSWQDYTRGPFRLQMLPGHHFYVRDSANIERVVNTLFTHAQRLTGQPPVTARSGPSRHSIHR